MTSAEVTEVARFDFGRVIGTTVGLIGRNFILFALLALVFVGAPQFAILYAQSTALTSGDAGLVATIGLGGVLVNLVTAFILQGALTRAAVDDLAGAGVKFGAAIGDGLRYFFPLLIVALLVNLGTGLGLLLLIVPGIILAVRWAMAAPILVVEDVGPTGSMGRSAELSSGHRWAIFGLLLLYVVFVYAVQIVSALVWSAFGAGDAMQFLTMEGTGLALAIANAAIAALISLVSTVGTAALYFELRRVKEGVGVEELARVFD